MQYFLTKDSQEWFGELGKLHILMWQFWDRTQDPTLTQDRLE